jgi:dihydrofolate synthase/folylpolyglutamate synthase
LVSTDPSAWLSGLEQFGVKFGLHNIGSLLDALGHPEHAFRSVHVGGTNGKGSVTAMVDAVLLAAGRRSARYTSPHLIDLSERFVIQGKPVERDELLGAIQDVRIASDRQMAAGLMETPPTFFEATTAAAFELFRRAQVGVAVCEVGMGGRLDATNVLQPIVTAITSIGLDHQQYLGNTLHEIALEKAGIVKPGVPVVVGKLPPAALAAVSSVARAQGARLIDASTDVVALPHPDGLTLITPEAEYKGVHLALRGSHQIANAAVAVRVVESLRPAGITVPALAIARGLSSVNWPGRLQVRQLADGREVLLDAAHNPDGAAALAAFLESSGERDRPIVFAVMQDKDAAAMLERLAGVAGAFVFTRASTPRAADPLVLAGIARAVAPRVPVLVEPTPAGALATAWRRSTRIVAAGSIFLLGDVIKEIGAT